MEKRVLQCRLLQLTSRLLQPLCCCGVGALEVGSESGRRSKGSDRRRTDVLWIAREEAEYLLHQFHQQRTVCTCATFCAIVSGERCLLCILCRGLDKTSLVSVVLLWLKFETQWLPAAAVLRGWHRAFGDTPCPFDTTCPPPEVHRLSTLTPNHSWLWS